jgi:hypothetical protein
VAEKTFLVVAPRNFLEKKFTYYQQPHINLKMDYINQYQTYTNQNSPDQSSLGWDNSIYNFDQVEINSSYNNEGE